MRAILVIFLVVFAVPALAVTYKWVDDSGTVNFTEDIGNVPKKYRKHVRIIDGEDNSAPKIIEEDGEAKGKAKNGDGKADAKEETAAKEMKKKTFGGKDEAAWRNEYRKLSADVKAAEDQLDQLHARLNDPEKMSRSEYLSIQHTIKNTEIRLVDLRNKVDAFDAAAAKAGVPASYRE